MLRRFAAAILFLAFAAVAPAAPAKPWLGDAVVYGVIPRLAGPHGLRDVTARLGDIAALGATVIWLSPINAAPPGDFGYAVTDPFRLNAALGTEADLRALVRRAHALGLKVILDIAVNDLSDRHPFYRDLVQRGGASPYRDFFARDATGAVTHYFDWTHLENLNYADPAVRAYVMDIFRYWLRDFDVDGFRVDAAWGPRRRAPGFWPQWSSALRRIKPDILLLAEGSERDSYYARAGFDAAYDWTDKPGDWAWAGAFADQAPASRLRAALARENDATPIFRFLDNNDTGERFISRYGPGMTRVATAMLLSLPGLPCLYMGDEVGARFDPYAAPGPIVWPHDPGLRDYIRRLISLRHREPALHSRRFALVAAPHPDVVLAYLRPGASPDESLLVLLNYSDHRLDEALSTGEPADAVLGAGAVVDLVSGETLAVARAEPVIMLPPFSARILRRAPAR